MRHGKAAHSIAEMVHGERKGKKRWRQTREWRLPAGTSWRDALIFRNTLIAIAGDCMVAFTRGTAGGSVDSIAQARRFRRPVTEHA